MTEDYIYEEKLSSNRTTILFVTLALLFLLLLVWRVLAAGLGFVEQEIYGNMVLAHLNLTKR
ncbi:MAG: hypothetical protein KAS36_12435 [Anaerolineales bacterium]|nr:hypothetical protein [Anaerolineales bacterium]